MARTKETFYSDIALAFNAHPVTGEIQRKIDDDAIKQSVKSLVLTNFYERPFRPDIGCSIRYLLFELFTPATKQMMQNAIAEVIENYEPRAELIDVFVDSNIDGNAINVTIKFRAVNQTDPEVVNFFLEKVR